MLTLEQVENARMVRSLIESCICWHGNIDGNYCSSIKNLVWLATKYQPKTTVYAYCKDCLNKEDHMKDLVYQVLDEKDVFILKVVHNI